MSPTSEPWKPSSYSPSKTALLLLDYENAHVNMIQDQERREKVIHSTKQLLTAARENNVAIVHCLMDTTIDPPKTSKGTEKWQSMIKPMLTANPDMVAEYSDFAITTETSSNGRESTSHRNPGYLSALVDEGLLLLLREKLGVAHLIMSGITTSGPVLGTATHATDLDFVVTVVGDACWDPDEQVHRALLDTVMPVLAWVSTVEEAVGHMSG
ncbi:putative hydrolase protein [Annulohypoxylon maeteangense]|uniref:putative hydrolase protein n=1 Tax=Annulohypoxylon maeteangense TaxID=1927788 RepID=UPI002008665C|nr:putative hydrolase protein [Annulohypoxylon maeteangense]KAI0886351.1 putative hydrolase protein [Annulohypoxylon maeteangense]